MKTDPISAAVGYRQALQRALQAKTHHEARKIIAQALDIAFDPPTEGHISISSGWGANTQQAYVTIALANPAEQLVVNQARDIAMQILEAAEAAESDGFLVNWLGGQQLTDGQIGALIADFRAWRDRRRQAEE